MANIKNKAAAFFRAQPVLVIAFAAALATVFIIPPDAEYKGYCSRTVLIQLFSLMLAVSGFRSIGVFDRATSLILRRTGSIRSLGRVLVLICFFASMLVTNDVALLTFVPLTIIVFGKDPDEKSRITTIVLETAAANMGSMLTPVGNPQNLFIYDKYNMSVQDFIAAVLPAGAASLVCLMGLCLLLPKTPCAAPETSDVTVSRGKAAAYSAVFMLCLACVLRLVPDWSCLIAAAAAALIFDPSLLRKVDYALLATFVCFFIFVGNIARIGAVSDFFRDILSGKEMFVALGLSQVISNVPAAVMLSDFTDNGKSLLLGVDLGGLGTMIASLASLISFQIYRRSEGAKPLRYTLTFTAVSLAMLAVLIPFVLIIG